MAALAGAQVLPGAVERELLRRAQQQDELLLRQRQFEEAQRPALDPAQRREIEQRQAREIERLRDLSEDQQRRLPVRAAEPPPDAAPYRAERYDRERREEIDRPRGTR